jgi:succinate dehydrogenase / fumarate reductase cytochrome b subunit
MADVNRGDRPLSPHLQIYRLGISGTMSILHRITGVGLMLGALLTVWWLLAAASGPEYFAFVDGLLTSWIGTLVMLGSLVALAYHTCTGIRHLWWDTGRGFDLDQVKRSGQLVMAGTGVLTLIVLLAA